MYQGQIIGDKYRVIGELGHGGTSMVYLAENISVSNYWAIKALAKNSAWFSCAMSEIGFLKDLSHPMLPRIVDVFEDVDFCYIVMDYIPGRSLQDYIDQEGCVPRKLLFRWTRDLLGALSYLHSKSPPIIYRDLKPSNILVDASGQLRLIDFGAARLYREESITDTLYIGTQGYAAPEQYGRGVSDQRTDLYNLGMTLIHIITGVHPAKQEHPIPAALRKAGLPNRFIKFIGDLVQPDPENRPQDCFEALDRLEKASSPIVFMPVKGLRGDSQRVFKGVIAVCSMIGSSGVTSFCLSLGKYFSKQGANTVLAELNPSGDFERIRRIYDKSGEVRYQSEACYKTKNMTFFPSVSDISEIPRKGVDVLILDLGRLNGSASVRELNRADIKLILCPNAPWKLEHVGLFNKAFENVSSDEWIYLINCALRAEETYIRKKFRLKQTTIFEFPCNPFTMSKEDERNTGKVVSQILSLSGQKSSFCG